MSPSKQEEYDASHDKFDTKMVYRAIERIDTEFSDLAVAIAALKKTAYVAARALDVTHERMHAQAAEIASLQKEVDRLREIAVKD